MKRDIQALRAALTMMEGSGGSGLEVGGPLLDIQALRRILALLEQEPVVWVHESWFDEYSGGEITGRRTPPPNKFAHEYWPLVRAHDREAGGEG